MQFPIAAEQIAGAALYVFLPLQHTTPAAFLIR